MAFAVSDALSSAIDSLITNDFSSSTPGEVHEFVLSVRRDIDRLCAVEARLLAQWDTSHEWAEDGSRSSAHRFSRETGLSVSDSKSLMSRARKLQSMPHTTEAFESGELSSSRVNLLVRTNQPNVSEAFARDEEMLVGITKELSFQQAAKAMAYWTNAADPDGAEDKASRLYYKRSASASKTLDDTLDLRALFDPIGGEIFLKELERLEDELFKADWAEAKATHGENTCASHLKRTPAQRRCDALVEMAKRSSAMPEATKQPKPLVTILVGVDEFKNICELANGTVITPSSVSRLMTEADIETVIFDGPRRVMGVTHRRSFTGAVKRAIEVRDRHCQHPSGCDVPAHKCEIDHRLAYAKAGATSEANGQLLCPMHNRVKGVGPP